MFKKMAWPLGWLYSHVKMLCRCLEQWFPTNVPRHISVPWEFVRCSLNWSEDYYLCTVDNLSSFVYVTITGRTFKYSSFWWRRKAITNFKKKRKIQSCWRSSRVSFFNSWEYRHCVQLNTPRFHTWFSFLLFTLSNKTKRKIDNNQQHNHVNSNQVA